MAEKIFWLSDVKELDDFGNTIDNEFVDGAMFRGGPWAIFTPAAYDVVGLGEFGLGLGQKFRKQADGRWLKVEG